MSATTRLATPAVLASLSVVLALARPLSAQDPNDPMPEVRQRLKAEAQRVEREFSTGRLDAYRLVQSDPGRLAEAVGRIQELLTLLENDRSLKPDRRTQLLVTLKADVRELQARAARARGTAPAEPPTRPVRDDVRRAEQVQRDGGRQIQSDVQSRFDSMRRHVADVREVRTQSSNRFLGANQSIEQSAVPEGRDYVLPGDWAEKSLKRSPVAKLSPQEKAVLEALKKPISADFTDATFNDVMDYLRKATGQEIVVDKQALDEVNVTYETPLKLQARKLTTRTVLKRVLADLGLTYVLKDGTIFVTSVARAKEMVATRTYYVGDLATIVDVRFGPVLSRIQAAQALATIVNLITSQIEPQTWNVNNPDAPGLIVYDPVTMTLIVRQTAEVHLMLGGGQ
jgi:hypothetical protein